MAEETKTESMADYEDEINESLKKPEHWEEWENLQSAMESKAVLQVNVIEAVKGGVVAYVDDIRGFIPASQLSLDYVKDLDSFVGKDLEVRVIELDPDDNRLILSAKEVLKDKAAEIRKGKIGMMTPGMILEGKVESIMPYGAFIDLGDGVSGLVHISQFSDKRIGSPREVVSEGQQVQVKVLNVKDGKVSLTMKGLDGSDEEAEEDARLYEEQEYVSDEQATTSLGSLLSGLKL